MIQAIDVPRGATAPSLFEGQDQSAAERQSYSQQQVGASQCHRYRLSRQGSLSRGGPAAAAAAAAGKMVEKTVIVHRDENGFGLRVKGQAPVLVEHVHENGAAWRAGVRPLDRLSKVNGLPVSQLDHKEVVLLFKGCSRFVSLTLLSCLAEAEVEPERRACGRLRLDEAAGEPERSSRPALLHCDELGAGERRHQRHNSAAIRRHQQSAWAAARRSDSVSARSTCSHLQHHQPAESPTTCDACRRPASREPAPFKSLNQLTCVQCNLEQPGEHQCKRLHRQEAHQSGPAPDQAALLKLAQSASSSSLPAKPPAPEPAPPKAPRPTNKRLEIIREFIDTEKTHTDRLRCLDELFYRPLKAAGYMTAEQLRQVFSCHRTLYKIHRQIYRILLSANHPSSALYSAELPLIGSALLEIFEGELRRRLERAACAFCAAQSTNVALLNKLTRRDSKVGEFLAHVTSQQMVGRLGIKDLLASCFQRLTKYPLLLESLLKATPVSPDAIQADQPTEDELEDKNFRDSQRMLAISLAEEREFIERALRQSRQILVKVNDSVKVTAANNKLKEIWRRTDKQAGLPTIDITKQQVIHEGQLTLRLSKRSFDVYVLLLTDYILILTREGQDKYKLKFFTPEGKSSSSLVSSAAAASSAAGQPPSLASSLAANLAAGLQQTIFSPIFIIDEHLTTRDAATDENGFYLLCKRKDDSRIYEFASQSPGERIKWRDRIQWSIDEQMSRADRRPSCESTITKSSSDISANKHSDGAANCQDSAPAAKTSPTIKVDGRQRAEDADKPADNKENKPANEPTKIEGTISYVEDDGIVMPSKMECSQALVEQAVQVNIY